MYENDRVGLREKGEEGEAAGRAGVRQKRDACKYPLSTIYYIIYLELKF